MDAVGTVVWGLPRGLRAAPHADEAPRSLGRDRRRWRRWGRQREQRRLAPASGSYMLCAVMPRQESAQYHRCPPYTFRPAPCWCRLRAPANKTTLTPADAGDASKARRRACRRLPLG